MTIYHIRLRMRPRGGNQWYKDRSERPVGTFCGAEPTAYDIPWADRKRAQDFQHPEKGLFQPCQCCKDEVAEGNLFEDLQRATRQRR